MLVDGASEQGDTGCQSGYRSAATIRKAPPIAIASSMSAAGRSLPNAEASRARNAYPPIVPITAPRIPAISPARSAPRDAPIAAPDRAPETIRAPNGPGALRLGVVGNWSVTSSASASSVRIHGVNAYPRNARLVEATLIQPVLAAQLTAAGAVIVRSPAMRPIRGENRKVVIFITPRGFAPRTP